MVDQTLNPTPLPHGKLAPSFSLVSSSGQTITRSQFRGKQALAVIFFEPTPEAWALLDAVSGDAAEYAELNARVIGIAHVDRQDLSISADSPVLVLADPQGTVWKAYSGTDTPGYGVFVLDVYGGVDDQRVAAHVADLPVASQILQWTRSAQYRCNI